MARARHFLHKSTLLITAALFMSAGTNASVLASSRPGTVEAYRAGSANALTPVLYLPQVFNANTGPLLLVAQRGATALQGQCDWEAGTLAYGWIHAWRVTQVEQYLVWARDWIDSCIPLKPTITHVNDGLLGYAALAVYEKYGQVARLDFAQKVADYLMSTATRTEDGTLTHIGDTVWDDTLLGVVPFLLEMSQDSGNAAYAEEAYAQVFKHANHLQDQTTWLYHHA